MEQSVLFEKAFHNFQEEFTTKLAKTIPKSILVLPEVDELSPYQKLSYAINQIANNPTKYQASDQFFKELTVEKKAWAKQQSPTQRKQIILNSLFKSIEQSKKKLNAQLDNYLTNINSRRKNAYSCQNKKQKQPFNWLKIKTKYPMLKGKLKTRLAQSINEYENQKKIREYLEEKQQPARHKSAAKTKQKVSLKDDNQALQQYQKNKITYQWKEKDEAEFLQHIKQLKDKFNHTQFLKICGRFKFISGSQYATLASEEVSRKLDKTNKIYQSRDFLLDKIFSTKQTLTENEMKFILKTSPLLSKCADKNFIRSAIKAIKYEDIDKMQLQIADEILNKFQQIRTVVRDSRRQFKQQKNVQVKRQIEEFQKNEHYRHLQSEVINDLHKHKIKMVRAMNYKQPKTYIQSQYKNKKQSWPQPMSKYHPATALFVKDCNEQCNQDALNLYENDYKEDVSKNRKFYCSSSSMKNFYTGGPTDDKIIAGDKENQKEIQIVCEALKSNYYNKILREKLNTISSDKFGQSSVQKPFTKRDLNDMQIRKTKHQIEAATQKSIKQKFMENKEKARTVVHINKLLISASQNSFVGLKALNPKFSQKDINVKDKKGNTALYYAAKNKNSQFVDFLISFGANPNIPCEKGNTPLHKAFQSSNFMFICKFLISKHEPNLNILNRQNKTALAYCKVDILKRLNLQEGVVYVKNRNKINFDNNKLLQKDRIDLLLQNKPNQLQLQLNL